MLAPKRAFLNLRPAPGRSYGLKDQPRGRRGSHLGRAKGHGPLFSPSDPVRETGIYEIIHHTAHRAPHDAVMLSGDTFPSCDTCAAKVRFRLVRTAPYIFQDSDFEDPDEQG